jgi:hypothetical protein
MHNAAAYDPVTKNVCAECESNHKTNVAHTSLENAAKFKQLISELRKEIRIVYRRKLKAD